MKLILIILILSFNCLGNEKQVFAESFPRCSEPDQSNLQELEKWLGQIDQINNNFLRTAKPGEHQTEFGTIIGKSCLNNFNVELIRKALKRMFIQSYRCEKALGYTPASDILSVIRRTKLKCTRAGLKYSMKNLVDKGAKYLGIFRVSRSSNRTHEMVINTEAYDLDQPVEELAKDLFHEAAHSIGLEVNSRSHDLYNRDIFGSQYTSRVKKDKVFYSAICFPGSNVGSILYRNLKYHSEQCENTFKNSANWRTRMEHFFIVGGKRHMAKASKSKQAKIFCNRLKNTYEYARQSYTVGDVHTSSRSIRTKFKESSFLPPPPNDKELREILNKVESDMILSFKFRYSGEMKSQLKKLDGYKKRVSSIISKACNEKPIKKMWYKLCLIKEVPAFRLINYFEQRLKQAIIKKDKLRREGRLAPDNAIKAFFDGPN